MTKREHRRRKHGKAVALRAPVALEPVESVPEAALAPPELEPEPPVISQIPRRSTIDWQWLLLLLLPAFALAFDSYQIFPVESIDPFVYLGFFHNLVD